jgi:hypothetical protein
MSTSHLEIYNGKLYKLFTQDDLTYKILGTFTTGTSNGSYTDNNINGQRVWFGVLNITYPSQPDTKRIVPPHISVSGNTFNWNFITDGYTDGRTSYTFVYGVY